jgi:hypothetical protein
MRSCSVLSMAAAAGPGVARGTSADARFVQPHGPGVAGRHHPGRRSREDTLALLAPLAGQPAVLPGIYTALAVTSITAAVAVQAASRLGDVSVGRSLLASGSPSGRIDRRQGLVCGAHPKESIIGVGGRRLPDRLSARRSGNTPCRPADGPGARCNRPRRFAVATRIGCFSPAAAPGAAPPIAGASGPRLAKSLPTSTFTSPGAGRLRACPVRFFLRLR